ncbi:hypothetical protein CAPTEDRAFT_210402 [Capitella teleta]|uniref:Nucleoside phosphorylase domain-containing protein n=1 Tax=Capitella teleta TaxID=283909 RepID=N1PB86_CAPTE|nr:hypothetical protein CAPTEDRAFT_210402 [Capitella teleta]|eukprot:ELU18921.1 hypothetical protein CAPTEDRAFT_210402 [Capitella teleta]
MASSGVFDHGLDEEEVVLAPLRSGHSKVVKIERMLKSKLDPNKVKHFAGGPYAGIVIHQATNKKPLKKDADAKKVFYAHVHDLHSMPGEESDVKERRELRFWFKNADDQQIEDDSTDFFQELLDPEQFPRDYISFLKRSLQLMKSFVDIKRLELHITEVSSDDFEFDADDLKVMARKKKKGKKGKWKSQDELRTEEEQARLQGYDTYNQPAGLEAGATPAGRNLDPALRRVASQEDILQRKPGDTTNSLHGEFHQGTSATGDLHQSMLSHTIGYNDGQDNSDYYARNLLRQSWNAEDSSVSENNTTVVVTKRSVKNIELSSSGISEEAARAALAAAGVTGLVTKSQYDRQDKASSADEIDSQLVPQGQWAACCDPQTVNKIFTEATNTLGGMPPDLLPPPPPPPKIQPVLTWKGWQFIWAAKKQKVLSTLEDAYPNVINTKELIKLTNLKQGDAVYVMTDLSSRGLIKEVEKGWWTREQPKKRRPQIRSSTRKSQMPTLEDSIKSHEFKVVAHIPRLAPAKQPTVAIITLLYSEKLAVDAMMESKTTFIRYKTEGEGQVYTVGMIGKQRVVCTKLARLGHKGNSWVAAGNVVTRLLGTFSRIEHVILVGVGGGILHLDDDLRNVRKGDVAVSKPEFPGGAVYTTVTSVKKAADGELNFSTKSWSPESDELAKIIASFQSSSRRNFNLYDAMSGYMKEALKELEGGEARFDRPPAELDRPYQIIRGEEVEVSHPKVIRGSPRQLYPDQPIVHYGGIGTGSILNEDSALRSEFAIYNEVNAIDSGFEAILDSIDGNCKESFCVIRGISDYTDGQRRQEWQPYAALAAAALMKAIVISLPVEEDDD